MAEIRIAKSSAPFGGQENGIDVGKLEKEVNAATGIVVISISTDAIDIIFTYGGSSPTAAALLALVQVHDGRPSPVARVISQGLPAYEGVPKHQSLLLQAITAGLTTVQQKVESDCRVLNGSIWVNNAAILGDTFTVEIVDVDGVVGVAGTVLMTPVDGLLVLHGGTGKGRMDITSGQALPIVAGLYIRITYNATGSTPVNLIAYWAEVQDG